MNNIHMDSPAGAGVPAIADDRVPTTPVLLRRRTTLTVLVGALVLAVSIVVLVMVTGPRTPLPSATPNPGAPAGSAPASATSIAAPSATTSAGLPAVAGRPTHYQRSRLPDLSTVADPNLASSARALNDRGQVVGQSIAGNGRPHPALWRDGRITDLGVLAPGPNDMGIAEDINAGGDAVGGSAGPDGPHAVLWRGGGVIDLGTLDGHGSFANAINDRGQIVGRSWTATGAIRGFIWENGQMRDLGIDPGVSGMTIPWDINGQGQVVGTSGPTESGVGRAFLWENGTVTWLATPGSNSFARAINDRGEIVGGYELNDVGHAVRWYHGAMTELRPLAGGDAAGAVAINERGQILGSSNRAPHSLDERPVMWARGDLYDLTAAGIPADAGPAASDINERGQILAGRFLYSPV